MKDKDISKNPLITLIVVVIFYIPILAYAVFSWGYVLHLFYYWFAKPVFVGLPDITLYQAYGLTFILGLFKNHSVSKKYKDHEQVDKVYYAISSFLIPWITLLSGYIVYSYIL